jgi:phytoene/squalene synthetase
MRSLPNQLGFVMALTQEQMQEHLDKVSRSFAACIAQLDQPLRSYVSLTYLLCRVIDSVEDARWNRLSEQLKAFELLDVVIEVPDALDLVRSDALEFSAGLSHEEVDLMSNMKALFKEFHGLPTAVRSTIGALIKTMARGMAYFVERRKDGVFKISTLREVNQYCFFVAGIVGETLANLLHAVDPRVEVKSEQVRNAHHFGLFLQKINLLKDQYKDEREGRFLVPSRSAVLQSMHANIEGGWRYIDAIPDQHKSYRIFCLWSYFLALQTLPLLVHQSASEFEPKISRESAAALFADLKTRVDDREYLKQKMQSLLGDLPKLASSADVQTRGAEPEDKSWFENIYSGQLTGADLKQLGLFST